MSGYVDLQDALGMVDSPEVAKTVRDFLASQPDYPQRLRWTILSAADELFRVADASR